MSGVTAVVEHQPHLEHVEWISTDHSGGHLPVSAPFLGTLARLERKSRSFGSKGLLARTLGRAVHLRPNSIQFYLVVWGVARLSFLYWTTVGWYRIPSH